MAFLEWLGNFVSSFFPPWEIVPATHVGVRQRNVPLPSFVKKWWDGVIKRDCGPGFVFRIPWIDEVWQLPVEVESEDLDNVACQTADGEVYDLSPALTWAVNKRSTLKACFDVSNYENSNKNAVRAIIVEYVNERRGLLDLKDLNEECSRRAARVGADWGCVNKRVACNSANRNWSISEMRHSLRGSTNA